MAISDMNYLMTALGAALEAGKLILEVYKKPVIERELKDDASPVTEADRAAHSAISDCLAGTGIPILSEEGRDIQYRERKAWKNFWLVDPLDGTKEFIRKNGEFTVNIALIEGQKPVLGVLYAPLPDLMYFSDRESGAFRMEAFSSKWAEAGSAGNLLEMAQRLPVIDDSRPFRVVASRSHRNRPTRQFIRSLKKKHPGLEIVSRGSALKFCLVAEGSADVYPRYGPTWEWDSGAGHAIAEAAGCTVSKHDLDEALEYNKENLLNPWFIVRRDK
jgi:3'(2'), 5'-bisphosphate nucleotidase